MDAVPGTGWQPPKRVHLCERLARSTEEIERTEVKPIYWGAVEKIYLLQGQMVAPQRIRRSANRTSQYVDLSREVEIIKPTTSAEPLVLGKSILVLNLKCETSYGPALKLGIPVVR